MSNPSSNDSDINAKFDEKIKQLENSLPALGYANCASLTLTHVSDILGIDNLYFNNAMFPLAGGFGGFKSKKGWTGACGAVCGGCAALGVIVGGKEKIKPKDMAAVYLKAAKFASNFEKRFGSVVCAELCGYDFSDPNKFMEYIKNRAWEKTCYKFVIGAIDEVRKLTKKELKTSWE